MSFFCFPVVFPVVFPFVVSFLWLFLFVFFSVFAVFALIFSTFFVACLFAQWSGGPGRRRKGLPQELATPMIDDDKLAILTSFTCTHNHDPKTDLWRRAMNSFAISSELSQCTAMQDVCD